VEEAEARQQEEDLLLKKLREEAQAHLIEVILNPDQFIGLYVYVYI
jgi:hypothetical protein